MTRQMTHACPTWASVFRGNSCECHGFSVVSHQNAPARTRTHTRTHTHTNTHKRTRTRTHTHEHARTHIHTYTQTHARTGAMPSYAAAAADRRCCTTRGTVSTHSMGSTGASARASARTVCLRRAHDERLAPRPVLRELRARERPHLAVTSATRLGSAVPRGTFRGMPRGMCRGVPRGNGSTRWRSAAGAGVAWHGVAALAGGTHHPVEERRLLVRREPSDNLCCISHRVAVGSA
jgi:hypothetical protein